MKEPLFKHSSLFTKDPLPTEKEQFFKLVMQKSIPFAFIGLLKQHHLYPAAFHFLRPQEDIKVLMSTRTTSCNKTKTCDSAQCQAWCAGEKSLRAGLWSRRISPQEEEKFRFFCHSAFKSHLHTLRNSLLLGIRQDHQGQIFLIKDLKILLVAPAGQFISYLFIHS